MRPNGIQVAGRTLALVAGVLLCCCRLTSVVESSLTHAIEPALGSEHTRHHIRRFSAADIEPRLDQEQKFIRRLGAVLKLDTFAAPNLDVTLTAKFSVFTRTHTLDGVRFRGKEAFAHEYEFDVFKLLDSHFDVAKRTVVLVPGYLTCEREQWVEEARKLWLELEDCNVIEMAWHEANKGMYWQAVAHTPFVARQLTIFLHYLAQTHGTTLKDDNFLTNVHIVGHSLGAHIAGFVGKDLGGRLGRITGLDPAGPTFDRLPATQRLSKSDAQLVSVIHTNQGRMKYWNALGAAIRSSLNGGTARKLMPRSAALFSDLAYRLKNKSDQAAKRMYMYGDVDTAWFGIEDQIGHVDYYANNGSIQPGCSDILHICDHGRANQLYNDMLRYELALVRQYASEPATAHTSLAAHLKSSRLVAFDLEQYGSFLTGEGFKTHCPVVMDWRKHLQAQDLGLNKCTVPIDLISPTGELIDELENVYGIPIRWEHTLGASAPATKRKFYFKTLSDGGHLLGDHYLLKIYLTTKPEWDADMCRLFARIEMSDGTNLVLNVRRFLQDNVHHEGEHDFATTDIVAVPFVHPAGVEARIALNTVLGDDGAVTENEITQMNTLLPVSVTLSASRAPTPKGAKFHLPDPSKCKLDTHMIEVHPVTGFRHANFAGMYTPPERVSVKSFERQVREVVEQRLRGLEPSEQPYKVQVMRFNDYVAQQQGSQVVTSVHAPTQQQSRRVAGSYTVIRTTFELSTIIYQ